MDQTHRVDATSFHRGDADREGAAAERGMAVPVVTVGVTGNVGSGKSTVASIWREHGAVVIDADALARELMESDRGLRRTLAIEFGDQILEPSASADVGALRRQELARRAFADPERTQALNRIVHPPLLWLLGRRLVEARRRAARSPVLPPDGVAAQIGMVVVDAALIFEVGAEGRFDVTVLVTAPLQARLQRLRARGLDEDLIQGLLGSQMPDEEKLGRADHVLVNDASLDALRQRSLELLARISSAPARHVAADSGGPQSGQIPE